MHWKEKTYTCNCNKTDQLKSGRSNSFSKPIGVGPNQNCCLYLTFMLLTKRKTSRLEHPATAITYSILLLRWFCVWFVGVFFSCYFCIWGGYKTLIGFSIETGTTFMKENLANQDVLWHPDHNIRMILTYWWVRKVLFVGTTQDTGDCFC